MHRYLITTLFIFGLLPASWASKTPAGDRAAITEYRQQCQDTQKYAIRYKYKVRCYNNYQHYNSDAPKAYSKSSARKKGTVRVASYNLLHPGSQRSIFKDFKLMAKIMNNWDLVVGLELLPIAGRDLENNRRVLKWLNSSFSQNKDVEVEKLYRLPGYLIILDELRKLDKSWGLILSPRGDSAKTGQVEEHVGFFYRGRMTKPIVNEHCQDYKNKGDGTAYACFPNFRKGFMGRETTYVFSRRPFLASFESGNFDFSILGSHLIYGSPLDKNEMKKILRASFGVNHYSSLGTGVNQQTYARFAEAKVTLEFMEEYRGRYKEQDLLYAADFNLTPENKFWGEVLDSMPGARLYQKKATTVTEYRYGDNNQSSGGLSSSYDHFIMDKSETRECFGKNGQARVGVYNTYKGASGSYLNKNYVIRKAGTATQTAAGRKKRAQRVREFKAYLKTFYTLKNGYIVWDDYQYEKRVKEYEKRVFSSQLINKTFYKFQQELLSDHMPITLGCSTN